jgi:hypothetical protein
MTKMGLVQILTLLIATVILLIALFSATFDGGEFINFNFGKLISEAAFSIINAFTFSVV